MPLGLTLEITDTANTTQVTRVFVQFPVRIGRNPLNDLQISEPFVSQFHAVLELERGTLTLRDLGSLNGTHLGDGRAPAHQAVDLSLFNGAFRIGRISFVGIVGNVEPLPTRTARMARLQAQAQAQAQGASAGGGATLLHTSVLEEPMRLDKTLAFVPGQKAAPGPAGTVAFSMPTPPTPDDEATRRRAMVALQGVIELGRIYLPRQQLNTPEDIAAFLSKLRDTLDVFLRSFIPLRDGYRQFASQMDLKSPARSGDVQRDGGGVLTARTEQALAERLLDLDDEASAAHSGIEGLFADLMIHQLALLNGIMRGVKSLLNELSPPSIEKALADRVKQGKGGFAVGPWRFKHLWALYSTRYADVDDGDKRTFAALFGKDFAAAYSEYRVGADTAVAQTHP